ncbi:secretion protein [Draconibacterium sediminis]|uniref:Secretion protein n=1 Tax=Draconibacterium sediminis TaxID=1544798 RepID=A0A0D8JF12_9BACT|nr:secretion protein [Draconibacterium sediminis]
MICLIILLVAGTSMQYQVCAQKAGVKIDSEITHQKITGFGGFVCSGTFQYNHMSHDEIRKLWGANSEAGYNIMRLYIPDENQWSSTLETAQFAQSLGIIIFASPWSMPASWKTNNHIAAKYVDNDGVEHLGYLKEEYYDDYALYLNRYVTYLRENGVELDAISIQNEPDMQSTYHGCLWTPEQLTTFLKEYRHLIDCKVMAPDAVGITNNYAEAFAADDMDDKFDIFAGHQYSYIQDGLELIRAKGKEVWMTEYLINWNADEPTERNVNWQKDAFNFAGKLNEAMLLNVNAWVHYASKRWYGLMGDGTWGTPNGELTKRGYILSHYAKYTTGTTRIEAAWNDDSSTLQGSAYLSTGGDSIILNVINPSENDYQLTVDLPFYTNSGNSFVTTEQLSMSASTVNITGETFRPEVSVNASSVSTYIFVESAERTASQMTGEAIYYNKIEDQTVTQTAFGTSYNLSGKTVTFDHSNSLISNNTSTANGYLELNDRYNQLIFHVKSFSSANQNNSDNTTLHYVNADGVVKSHNYGRIDFPTGTEFDITFDISRNVLTEGCIGLLGISNSNYSSVLTMNFGDVYLKLGNEKMYKFSGIYSPDDSYLIDGLEDEKATSVDFTETTGISSNLDWNAEAANTNCIFYVAEGVNNTNTNVVVDTVCSQLALDATGGDFYAPHNFKAELATFTCTVNGYRTLVLPFEATIPEGVKVYTMEPSSSEIFCTRLDVTNIAPNQPVLISGNGTFSFEGSGKVSTPHAISENKMNGVYIGIQSPPNSYYLKSEGGVTAFDKAATGNTQKVDPFSAYLTEENSYSAASLPLTFDNATGVDALVGTNTVIKLYPNPANNQLFLQLASTKSEDVIISVLDLSGRTIKNTIKHFDGHSAINIKISDLPDGFYVLQVKNRDGVTASKFFVRNE